MKQVGHIRLIGAECSEGIIIIDLGQSIVWANAAALAMHNVAEVSDLGETIDEYHARFQVKYVAVLPRATEAARDVAEDEYGRSQPEVLMEVKPQSEMACSSVFRTRKKVMLDDSGRPSCIVFIMHKMSAPAGVAEQLSDLLGMFRHPAAILRAEDRSLVAANAAYLSQSAPEPATLGAQASAYCETSVEVNGQGFTLLHCSAVAPGATTGISGRTEQGSVAGLFPLGTVPMHALDDELRIVDVSQAWLDWLGYTRNVVIGRTIFEFIAAPSVDRFERHTRLQMIQGGKTQDLPVDFVTKGGAVISALISAAVMPEGAGERALLVSTCVDVTPHKRLEDALAATFALAPVPMLVRKCDDGRIVDANEAFLKATGFGASDVVGHGFDEFGSFESKKRKEEFDALVHATGHGEMSDVVLKTSQGDTLDCVLTATKIWMFGKPCVLLALQDFSERCRTELELMSALEAVMKDSSWFSRSVVERLAAMRAPPKSGRPAAALGDLTPRERDVLSLISLGLPDAEIAERLGLTRSTIRNHLSTLYSKINVKNRGSAIIWARDRCLNVTQLPLRPKTVRPDFGPGRPTQKQMAPLGQGARIQTDAKTAAAK